MIHVFGVELSGDGLLGAFFGVVFLIAMWLSRRSASARCAEMFCGGRKDPRCAGGNCTFHCQSILGCHARCLNNWVKSDQARDLAEKLYAKAKSR